MKIDGKANSKIERQQDAPARGLTPRTRIEAAAKSPYNLLALSLVVAGTAITLTPWPLLAGLLAEAAYLGLAAAGLSTKSKSSVTDASVNISLPVQPPARTEQAPSTLPSNASKPAQRAVKTSLPDRNAADEMTGEAQDRYLRLEATNRLIRLQLDEGNDIHRDLISQLQTLMERFVYFARKQEQFHERLQSIVDDARALRAKAKPAAGVVDLQLVYAPGEGPDAARLEEWVQLKMKQAHDAYEQELRDLSWKRQERVDGGGDPSIDRQVQHLLRCNKQVDKIGKTLLNLHYELQLLDKKFAMTSEELSTRRIEQVLADVKALVLQTQSLMRTVEDIEPLESASEYVAA